MWNVYEVEASTVFYRDFVNGATQAASGAEGAYCMLFLVANGEADWHMIAELQPVISFTNG